MMATVYSGINNIYQVRSPDGDDLECRIKGKILQEDEESHNPLAPGDRVECRSTDSARGLIVRRYPRTNRFGRWNKKRGAWQTVAANLDGLVAVISAGEPPFRPRFVDRVLIAAAQGGVTPSILVNKIDLGLDAWVDDRIASWTALGIEVHRCSAETGSGLDELKKMWGRGTIALFGPSGVGKSTLINRLVPGMKLPTGGISKKYDRGRHVTNFGRLIDAPWGGRIVDTPGVREIAVHGIPADELSQWFNEFVPFARRCSFQPCTHRGEPDCGVRRAGERGLIHPDRYENYLRILKELVDGGRW